ncbi:MAG: tetratricopeptide repeat protein, partial [Sandaracinaceae bacterium]|nr:tetratricopeptide repeat protein [Sandaracinaceae bacterium]
DAMVALAREDDALAALEGELAARRPVAALDRGVVLEELGREDEALAVLEQVLGRSPRDAETRQRVVRLLARNGRIAEALEHQRALARLFPDRIALTLELASALRDQGRPDEALAELDHARVRARRDRTALFLLVDAYARLGARDRVLATLEAIVRADPRDPRALVALANELLESRDPADRDRALALVERVATTNDVAGHVEAARSLSNLRAFDRAFEHLEAAARLAPDAPEVLDAQADLFERAGRTEDAERALVRRVALAGASDDPQVREAGLDAESRLVASWDRHHALAQHRAELEARFAQGDASAGRMLADLQRRSGHPDEAFTTLSALSQAHPEDARLVAALARLEHERGDYDAEVRALQRLAALEPARAGWHLSRLVELALATYHDEDAIRFADEASRRSIGDAELFVRLGRLHARRRDPERAAEAYTHALEIDPDAHEAAWELAGIERERGHARRATELLLSILERSRDDDLRERAGRAVLEAARADGSEASLEPRLLALALAHGDAPVFRHLALALYGSLSGAARARGDTAELERWVSRALPILLAALRDADVGTRASARQLLFGHPVRGAAPALLALALDDAVEAPARIEALAAALRVVGPDDVDQLLALLDGPSETLAIFALHGLVRVLPPTARGRADRARVLAAHLRGPGRLSDHAWALTILLGPEAARIAPHQTPSSPTAPWLATWFAAQGHGEAAALTTPLRELLARQAASRGRDEALLATAVELAASGPIEDALLDELAHRALAGRDGYAHLAERALRTRVRPSLDCAPVLARSDSLESWLGRVIAACPRVDRPEGDVVAALVGAVGALREAEVARALELVASQAQSPAWA